MVKKKEDENPTHREILWRDYSLGVDLYKHYTELVLKTNAFFYLITGGIVTYYLTNSKVANSNVTNANVPIEFSLILPILMSIFLGIGFFYGSVLVGVRLKQLFKLRAELGLDRKVELGLLGSMFLSSGIGFLIVGIALTVLMILKIPKNLVTNIVFLC